ncbi:MAG: DinB family protein [Vicinamibacterales bacterium]
MKLTDLFLTQLDAEAARTRRTLEHVPAGHEDWKPHDRSMPFGRLAGLVAIMPSWLTMVIKMDELDINPKGGSNMQQKPLRTSAELVQGLDEAVDSAREALSQTSDDFLMTPWKLLSSGALAQELPRHVVIRDTFMHLSHHRGQLTVYLRLLGAPVASVYGPTADDKTFA